MKMFFFGPNDAIMPDMAELQTDTDATILNRLIAPSKGGLCQEAANALLRLEFPDADIARMNDLAEKNRGGSLSPTERERAKNRNPTVPPSSGRLGRSFSVARR